MQRLSLLRDTNKAIYSLRIALLPFADFLSIFQLAAASFPQIDSFTRRTAYLPDTDTSAHASPADFITLTRSSFPGARAPTATYYKPLATLSTQ